MGSVVMTPAVRHRSLVRNALVAVLAVVLVAALGGALTYRRQLVSFLTHWKGAPEQTTPYEPFPASDPPALRIAVIGDSGDGGGELDATAAAITSIEGDRPFDLLLLLGDNVYPDGDPARLAETVFEPFGAVLQSGTRLLAIVGNHDEGYADEQLAALDIDSRWWSVERDGVLLIGLDSNTPDDPQQLAWLEETLRTTNARWRIVALHHPPYSAGYQGSNTTVRDTFVPIFRRYGVQLVLSGHDHDYQRSVPMDGVTYIVTGSASGSRRTGAESFTAVSFATLGFVELGVYPDRLVLRSVDHELRVGDEWVLHH